MIVLGIETSCDETAAAVVTSAREIRVHTVLLMRRGIGDGKIEIRRRTHTTRELLRNLVMR